VGFDNLFQIEGIPADCEVPPPQREKKPKKKDLRRGCEFCPLNKVEGIKKIRLGTMTGKKIWVVAQSPGPEENEEEEELVGPSGRWWWKELRRIGITRDMCDIQNVVRCFPADLVEGSYDSYLKMRTPNAEEIRCCSLYTDEAIAKSKAPFVLVLGQIAAKALLATRSLPKRKIFWSDKLSARVYLLDHPAFFIRGYASASRLDAFRKILDEFKKDFENVADRDLSDQFAYIKSQDYRLVDTEEKALKAEQIIRKYGIVKNRRIAVDIEDHDTTEGHIVNTCGFSPKPGLAFVFIFCHAEQERGQGAKVQLIAKRLLENPKIKKALHFGCSDDVKLEKYAGIKMQGFVHDTNKSEYLRFSDAREYGLDAIAERRFPEFTGYKYIVVNEMLAMVPDVPKRVLNGTLEGKYTYLDRHRLFNVGKLSMETLRLYNGADCDLTKRLDIDNYKHVSKPLLRIYMDLSYVLQRMEPNGPWFDYLQNKKLERLFPGRERRLRKRCQKLLGNKKFNPGSPQQVNAALFNVLDLEYPGQGKPNTKKGTLLMMSRSHKFPGLILEWRGADKASSTYVESYKICADMNDGRLRTSWWDTGTRTGRLSSGGGKAKGRINLQNIHNDPHVRNQCVADKRWRQAYKAIKEILTWAKDDEEAAAAIEKWVQENIPDLETFLILDYGQVEVRVAAQLSGDENLIADCKESDIHTKVGATMTGWDPEKIRNDHRTRTSTKNIHFAIIYGSNVDGVYAYVVSRTPPDVEPLTREQVEKAFVRYFERYSGVRLFIDSQRQYAIDHGYVETIFGMKQNLVIKGQENGEDHSNIEETGEDDGSRSSFWANQAVNGPVQGTAHQLLECALVRLHRYPEKYKLLNVPVMDVHDALYFSVKVLKLQPAAKKAKWLMEKGSLATVKSDFPDVDWKVPIVTEAEAALTLGCKVKLTDDMTPGKYLLQWYHKRRKQDIELRDELAKLDVAESTPTNALTETNT